MIEVPAGSVYLPGDKMFAMVSSTSLAPSQLDTGSVYALQMSLVMNNIFNLNYYK